MVTKEEQEKEVKELKKLFPTVEPEFVKLVVDCSLNDRDIKIPHGEKDMYKNFQWSSSQS